MNKRIVLTIGAVLVLLVAGAIALFWLETGQPELFQKPAKVYRIGILDGFDFFGGTITGFKEGLTGLGFIEGKNVQYDVQTTGVNTEKYDEVLRKFADDKVDLIMTFPTEASLEAKKVAQTTGIPVVFTNANVEGVDLIDSIQKPGNNITGVRYPGPDIASTRLEIMKKLVPAAHDILVPYDKTYLNVPPQLDALHKEAAMLNINIIEVPVETPEELQTKLDALFKEGQKIDAIVNIAETVSGDPSYVEVLGKFAEEHEIPWGGALTLKKDGYTRESLFGISVDPVAVGQQAAQLAEKILVGGIPAGTIPVSSAESYFVINYGAMTKMGITPDKSILAGAQEVIR